MGGKLLVILCVALCVPLVQAACVIDGHLGPLTDTDCDGFPDRFDVCPDVRDSDQRDTDRDGVGDACDTLIDIAILSPSTTFGQGEHAQLTIRATNARDRTMEDIAIRVRNANLHIDETQQIPVLPAGHTATVEFLLRLPCAKPGTYNLIISSEASGRLETITRSIRIEARQSCGTGGVLDHTVVALPPQVRLERGESSTIPITITNLDDDQHDYTLRLDQDWAVWRIDPAAALTVQPGAQATVFLTITGHAPGSKDATLVIASDGERAEIPLHAYVRAPLTAERSFWPLVVQAFIILLLVGLIVAAVIIAIVHTRTPPPPRVETPRTERTTRKATRKRVSVERADESLETNW